MYIKWKEIYFLYFILLYDVFWFCIVYIILFSNFILSIVNFFFFNYIYNDWSFYFGVCMYLIFLNYVVVLVIFFLFYNII